MNLTKERSHYTIFYDYFSLHLVCINLAIYTMHNKEDFQPNLANKPGVTLMVKI